MSEGGLRLTLRAPLPARLDATALTFSPELDAAEIARRELWLEGRGYVPVGELFDVRGGTGPTVRIEGDLARADGLGTGLAGGELIVAGSIGAGVGAAMSGGRIEVLGDAGPRAGGAPPGAKRGMTGGEIIIRGSAGPGAGMALRRGLIVITGDAGEGAGYAAIAGTVIVFGRTGPRSALWSKRGSLVALGGVTIPPTYRYACTYRPPHLRLTFTYLGTRRGLPVAPGHFNGLYRRHSGDFAELGAGEILEWIP